MTWLVLASCGGNSGDSQLSPPADCSVPATAFLADMNALPGLQSAALYWSAATRICSVRSGPPASSPDGVDPVLEFAYDRDNYAIFSSNEWTYDLGPELPSSNDLPNGQTLRVVLRKPPASLGVTFHFSDQFVSVDAVDADAAP